MNIDSIKFYTKSCSKLTEKEINDSSLLFSEHYGVYSSFAPPDKAGKQIKLGPKFYRNLSTSNKFHVSFAYYEDLLLGHAFYLMKEFEGFRVSWVIQLVVHSEYRRLSIGKKLLYSVWGFSNDLAWGLATSNPLTIKTLESATFRKVLPKEINKHSKLIRDLSSDILFIQPGTLEISEEKSLAFTNFFVDHEDIPSLLETYEEDWLLGALPEGHEWIAFTFQEQEFVPLTKDKIDKLIEFSDKVLKEAYSRMDMTHHDWSKRTVEEVEFILEKIPGITKNSNIADFGCGIGRHLSVLINSGYKNITGIDFSKTHIDYCNQTYSAPEGRFIDGDCRTIDLEKSFDAIFCLYDVIGSFPDEQDNEKIINNIYAHLKPGGIAVISVMNMELTEAIAIHKVDIYKSPNELFKLKASSTMQQNGNVFKPEYYLIDTNSKLVYRKEIFKDDDHISAEYIIRDKRYTGDEISQKLTAAGFDIIQLTYVQAGRFERQLSPTDPKAKEILIFAKKR